MRKILVTGAAGFIGSHLCEALVQRGDSVIGIDNFDPFYPRAVKENNLASLLKHPHFQFAEGNAGDSSLLNAVAKDVDVVVHLAANAGVQPSLRQPMNYITNNIGVTNSLLEWMRENAKSKMVFASSSSVYGNNPKVPFAETDAVDHPISPYAFTKRACELMMFTYHDLYKFDVINLRFFTVFGERQRPDLAIHKFLKLILNGQPITVYGDGSTSRDYTYVGDTVQGILGAIDYISSNSDIYEIVNLGNQSPVPLLELIKAIGEAAEAEPLIHYAPMQPGDVNVTYAAIQKAGAMFDYHPAVSLKEGLQRFAKWYRTTHAL